MNEHNELEPTVAIPRVSVAAEGAGAQRPQPSLGEPVPAQSVRIPVPLRSAYVFGNPFTYALRRFCAFVLDVVVVSAVATMLLYGLIAINPFTGLPNNSEGGFDATVGMGVASALVSIWILEALVGTTLGKLAFSLHVYAQGRRFVGFGRALVRNILRPIDMLVVGWLLAMAPGHRRLGDLLGGTVVAQGPLRTFSPLVGWILIVALAALPFLVAGGTVTVLAVAAAFIEFIPPLIARVVQTLLQLAGGSALHLPPRTG